MADAAPEQRLRSTGVISQLPVLSWRRPAPISPRRRVPHLLSRSQTRNDRMPVFDLHTKGRLPSANDDDQTCPKAYDAGWARAAMFG